MQPTPADGDPTLIAASADTAALLGLDPREFGTVEFLRCFAGVEVPRAWKPWAQCYGGHQFGSWAGQLGDGRAISLTETVNASGERWELQLKGAGKTPYSRRADGRAVLRSSLREYVASEAMAWLGIPTTRALSLVATNDGVVRDMFYNGNAKLEPGAVVCRVARSFLRFGTWQLPASRSEDANVALLTDYTIAHHYPHLQGQEGARAAWFKEVCERTARLAAAWQAVGFVHGVLNTDNMSILGDSIDYGPYGWMELYDPVFTPNTTDFDGRRYCYANQPQVMMWNCAQLANALLSAGVLTRDEAQAGVDAYPEALKAAYTARFAAKLGLREHNEALLRTLMELLATDSVDFTRSFRALSAVPATLPVPNCADAELLQPLRGVLPDGMDVERVAAWAAWVRSYRAALVGDAMPAAERAALQDGANPWVVPRNYLLQIAIEAAEKGDFSELERLLDVLRTPFTEQPGAEKYAAAAPEWASRPGVCMLSCSS